MPKHKSKKLRTSIGVVLDESGSMLSREQETIQTFNDYFDSIQEEDPSAIVTVAKFSQNFLHTEDIRFLCRNETVKDMPYLDRDNYIPSGGTPLLDAVGKVITEMEHQLFPDRYLLVILTDGMENASREFTREQVVSLITERQRRENWTVVFLGAGIDAWAQAQWLGINSPGNVFGYSGKAGTTRSAGQSLSSATASYLASEAKSSQDFLTEEKQKKVASSVS